ncbi:MAG: HEAT repeat domain-containing protein [Pseudomonadota bacterium]
MATIKPFIPFSLPFAATGSLGQTQVASTMLAAGFQSSVQDSAYVNSDQSFKAGTLFPRANTLFMERERALESMAGVLIANGASKQKSFEPIEFTLELAGVPVGYRDVSKAATNQPMMFAASNANSDNEVSEDFDSLVRNLKEGDMKERLHAVWVLDKLGDPRAVEPLIIALKHQTWLWVGNAAAMALVKIGSAAVEPLIKMLTYRNKDVRIQAASALGDIGDPRAVEPLTKALKSRNKEVRKHVAKALEKLRSV